MSSGSEKQPAQAAVPAERPARSEIDAGFRHWYNACSCCLGEHFPDIRAALDAEAQGVSEQGGTFATAGTTSEIPRGGAKQVETSGPTLAVFNVSGTFYAIDDRCPHMGCPLSDGKVDGTILTCACHGSQFDVTTGALVHGPATKGVRTHAVRVSGDEVEVEV